MQAALVSITKSTIFDGFIFVVFFSCILTGAFAPHLGGAQDEGSGTRGALEGAVEGEGSRKYIAIAIIPLRTAVPFWGQTTYNLHELSPQWECGAKRVNNYYGGP